MLWQATAAASITAAKAPIRPTGRSLVRAMGTVSWLRMASLAMPSSAALIAAAAAAKSGWWRNGIGDHRDEDQEQAPLGDIAPIGQDIAHLGLVGAFGRGVVGLGALPGQLPVDDARPCR